MSRSAASPRVFQLYSPRRPSPLGLPPLAPGSQDITCSSAYPKTPERYYLQHSDHHHHQQQQPATSFGMRFPPDVHRRSTQQRSRASPPAPLSLDSQYHPAAVVVVHLPSIAETLHPTQEMSVPPSPTPSSTSSLSLYSAESAKKSLEVGEGEVGGRKKGGGGGFCLCFSAFLSLSPSHFTKKKKNSSLLTFYPIYIFQTSQRSSVLNLNQTRFSLLLEHNKC